MSTKEKILDASLKLFNQDGVDKVTVRQIAAEIGISHGNLCYHYKRKEDIVIELFSGLVDEMNRHLHSASPENFDLTILLVSIRKAFATLYKYRFLLLDMVQVFRKIPELKDRFTRLELQRREEFRRAFVLFKETGYFKNEISSQQITIFVKQLFLISNFWLSEAEVLFTGEESDKIDHYSQLAFALVLPFLTEKGLKEYNQFDFKL